MLLLCSPFIYLPIAYYLDVGDTNILFIPVFLVLVIIIVVFFLEPESEPKQGEDIMLLLGMMGSSLLHHSRDRENKKSPLDETLYWQESIREKNSMR